MTGSPLGQNCFLHTFRFEHVQHAQHTEALAHAMEDMQAAMTAQGAERVPKSDPNRIGTARPPWATRDRRGEAGMRRGEGTWEYGHLAWSSLMTALDDSGPRRGHIDNCLLRQQELLMSMHAQQMRSDPSGQAGHGWGGRRWASQPRPEREQAYRQTERPTAKARKQLPKNVVSSSALYERYGVKMTCNGYQLRLGSTCLLAPAR